MNFMWSVSDIDIYIYVFVRGIKPVWELKGHVNIFTGIMDMYR